LPLDCPLPPACAVTTWECNFSLHTLPHPLPTHLSIVAAGTSACGSRQNRATDTRWLCCFPGGQATACDRAGDGSSPVALCLHALSLDPPLYIGFSHSSTCLPPGASALPLPLANLGCTLLYGCCASWFAPAASFWISKHSVPCRTFLQPHTTHTHLPPGSTLPASLADLARSTHSLSVFRLGWADKMAGHGRHMDSISRCGRYR